jgi:hypothetical protein
VAVARNFASISRAKPTFPISFRPSLTSSYVRVADGEATPYGKDGEHGAYPSSMPISYLQSPDLLGFFPSTPPPLAQPHS